MPNLLPEPEELAGLYVIEAQMAHKRAEKWAAAGVDPGVAAHHGAQFAELAIGWFIAVFLPGFVVTALVWIPLPFLMVWKIGVTSFFVVVSIRFFNYAAASPGVAHVYRIRTAPIVIAGGIWMWIGGPLALMGDFVLYSVFAAGSS